MALVYLILAHRLPEQAARLVSALYHEDDVFLLHVDAKADFHPFGQALNSTLSGRANVLRVEPVRCDWGGFGHVEATLRGIDHVMASRHDFSHLLLLTGQDYPIKSVEHIRNHFQTHPDVSFMSWSAGDGPVAPCHNRIGNDKWYWDGAMDRLERRWFLVRGEWRPLPNSWSPFFPRKRKMPLGLSPYQGSAYWALSRNAIEHVHRTTRTHPDLVRFFKRVFLPDENFFQMTLLNSPLRDAIVNDDLRYMNWGSWHPATLGKADLDDLSVSRKLFARKFDATVDSEVLDIIDSTLLSRRSTPAL